MNTKMYVGSLPPDVTENDLRELFSPHGSVEEVHLMLDRLTGRPRGFAFVTMATKEEADASVLALNSREWKGYRLAVNEARPREDRPAQGGGSRGRGGYPNRF